jgi:8-oxo-dGTP pyrophosphatase MutT (NUDIX family)
VSREPHALHLFALVVVEADDGRFLLVQERKHGQSWYLPAGRVDPGEDFAAAALRETLEEAGLPIRLTGMLRLEHSPSPASAAGAGRMRAIFVARPSSTRAPKSTADEHSLQAAWFTLAEIKALPLRGPEAYDWCAAVAAGAAAAPLSLFTAEGRP